MNIESSLDGINKKLAATVGYIERIESAQEKIGKGLKSTLSGWTGGGFNSGSGNNNGGNWKFSGQAGGSKDSGGKTPGLASFGQPPVQPRATTSAAPSQGSASGGGSGYNNSGGNMLSGALGTLSSFGAGTPMGGALAFAGAVGTAAWNATPGIRDAAAYQGALFPTAFSMPGGYSNKGAAALIARGIGQGASGQFDAQAAMAMATNAGFGPRMGVSGQMLGAASFAFQMTGMSNPAAMAGQMSMYRGTSGVSNKLMRIGIMTVGSNGKPKDMGRIVDELWAKWYGSKNAKVPAARYEADLAMGFVGSDLAALFGDQPDLYEQVLSFLKVKANAGGKSGMTMDVSSRNFVGKTAKRLGMNEYNTPTVKAGEVNSARMSQVGAATEAGLMNAYVNSGDAIVKFNSAIETATENLGGLAGLLYNLKGFMQGTGSSEIGPVYSLLGGLVSKASGGTSTSDSINARLSKGEYVINARAAQMIGLDHLNALNNIGRDFGSGFASPARMLAKGGAPSGADIVAFATQEQFLNTPYKDHTKIKDWGPSNGWDCSSFTSYVFKQFGYTLPALSDEQFKMGTPIGRDEIQPGDLLFFKTNDNKTTGHVGLYTGNGMMMHAANSSKGTVNETIDSWYWDRFVGARRISGNLSIAEGAGVASPGADAGSDEEVPGLYRSATGATAILKGATSNEYSEVGSTSLRSLGKSGNPVGSFTKGYVSAASLSVNASVSAVMQSSSSGGITQDGAGTSVGSSASLIKPEPQITGPTASPSDSGGGMPNKSLLDLLQRAGFVGDRLREAWAIAKRESGGRPGAHNGNRATGDDSYGLFQINMLGSLEGERLAKFKRFGVTRKEDLLDAWKNAQAAAYMSQKGDNWSSWVSPQYGAAADYYKEFPAVAKKAGIPGYSAGTAYVESDQLAYLHQGETVIPAQATPDFRRALHEMLNGSRGNDVTINLKIERASDEEAERFARKVKQILANDARMERMRTR